MEGSCGRVSWKGVVEGCHGRELWKGVMEGSCGRVPWKGVVEGCHGRELWKSVMKGSCGRVSWKGVVEGFLGRVFRKCVLEGCPGRIPWKGWTPNLDTKVHLGDHDLGPLLDGLKTPSDYVLAANNPDVVDKLEGLVAQWSKVIEQVLAESEQMRKEADDIGPTAELEHWKERMAKFNVYVYSTIKHRIFSIIATQGTYCTGVPLSISMFEPSLFLYRFACDF
ncbi:hypothetical protein OS493_013932 [Desmophyllum pertusum]|uniref:Dynein heavy chain tail domain-containing protein n=1 Tax=Desmophyllum pertusum TaxID=174260 RepID=A0A9W9ZQE1_9CNID|nr:hypothetical protein OS493_013932 [Desmophyllum pertusum]